jgi:hypothetical protein
MLNSHTNNSSYQWPTLKTMQLSHATRCFLLPNDAIFTTGYRTKNVCRTSGEREIEIVSNLCRRTEKSADLKDLVF